jgi:hypothetical protein
LWTTWTRFSAFVAGNGERERHRENRVGTRYDSRAVPHGDHRQDGMRVRVGPIWDVHHQHRFVRPADQLGAEFTHGEAARPIHGRTAPGAIAVERPAALDGQAARCGRTRASPGWQPRWTTSVRVHWFVSVVSHLSVVRECPRRTRRARPPGRWEPCPESGSHARLVFSMHMHHLNSSIRDNRNSSGRTGGVHEVLSGGRGHPPRPRALGQRFGWQRSGRRRRDRRQRGARARRSRVRGRVANYAQQAPSCNLCVDPATRHPLPGADASAGPLGAPAIFGRAGSAVGTADIRSQLGRHPTHWAAARSLGRERSWARLGPTIVRGWAVRAARDRRGMRPAGTSVRPHGIAGLSWTDCCAGPAITGVIERPPQR